MARTYSPELKTQVIAEWKAGSSLDSLAKAHTMPKATVQAWTSHLERVPVSIAKRPEPYDLDEMAIRLINGSVNAVSAIHGVTEDGAWLRSQTASELAILLGVISDKLYRLLEAIHPQRVGRTTIVTAGPGEDS